MIPDHPRPASPSDLFWSFTWLALQGFGGVLAIVQRELVEKKQWLTLEEFVEDWAVAQILPGPNVVNLSLMIGDRYFGLRGALMALAGILTLPLLVVLTLAALFAGISDVPGVAGALRGMGAVAAGLIAATGIKLIAALKRNVMGRLACAALASITFVAIALARVPLVRVFAAKRGVDLSAFTLLPFGGAGAVHAAAVAEELGMRRILVPARPGAFSALGLLCTDVVHDYIRSELKPLDEVTAEHVEEIYQQLEAKAQAELKAEGMQASDARLTREIDLRYAGQGYELRTPLDGLFVERLSAASLTAARARFDERHAQIHGHAAKSRPVEVVSYRLRLRVAVPKYKPVEEPRPAAPQPPGFAEKGSRRLHMSGNIAVEATVYERDRLDIGARIAGPAIVEQFDATTVIPPGWSGRVDGYRNLMLEKEKP